jgi:replicative DNA helicase
MDIKELKYKLLQDLESVLEHLLPHGKRKKDEFCVGSVAGEAGESLRVHLKGDRKGVWSDFSDGNLKGDIIDLWRAVRNLDQGNTFKEIRDYLGVPYTERKKKVYKRPDFPPYEVKQEAALKYLIEQRKISRETLDLFCIAWDRKDIILPYYRNDELLHWKKLGIHRPEGKKVMISSPGTEPCLFGWQAVTNDTRSIIICEGELDAMSFREFGFQALSLPLGGGKGEKQAWIDNEQEHLAKYDTIFLAVDDDYEGHEAAKEIVFRLGQHRCKLVKLPYKDCNECLAQGVERSAIEDALRNATTVSIETLRGLAPAKNEPPHSTELEQFVLCWLLNNSEDKHLIFSNLETEDFYWPSHQMIYRAAGELHKAGQSLGIVNIIDRLTAMKVYGDVVSRGHLDDLRLVVPGISIPEVCSSIRGMATRRLLTKAGEDIIRISFEEVDSTRAVSHAQQDILAVSEREISRGQITLLGEAMVGVLSEIEYNMKNPNEIRGIRTGFYKIDMMLRGFKPGQLIIIAARPAMGKTSYLLNVIHDAVIVQHQPAVLFSMEMSDSELYYRLIAIQTGINTRDMKSGHITQQQFDTIADWYLKVAAAPLWVQDTAGMTPDKMHLSAERMKMKFDGLGIIAVDYLQLMECDNWHKGMSTNEKVTNISRGLKNMAKDMRCPVLAASQLSRNVELRPNKRPMLSDLRDSGAIEQDADVVKFIYRDEVYNKDTDASGIAEINIAKQREGPEGVVELIWDPKRTLFRNMVERAADPMPPM